MVGARVEEIAALFSGGIRRALGANRKIKELQHLDDIHNRKGDDDVSELMACIELLAQAVLQGNDGVAPTSHSRPA